MKRQVHQHLTSNNSTEHSQSFLTKPSTSLSSDSSDNEDHPQADKKVKSVKSKIRRCSQSVKKEEESDDDDTEMASQLENLAKFHSQVNFFNLATSDDFYYIKLIEEA